MKISRIGLRSLATLGIVASFLPLPGCGKKAEAPQTQPAEEEKKEPGEVVLEDEQLENAGVETDYIVAQSLQREVRLLGVIRENPADHFVLRSEAAGAIAAGDKPWPKVGDIIPDGAVIGMLQPRLSASDQIALSTQRVTLQTQIAAARSDLAGANASVTQAKASYERLKELNAQDKNVSDRAVEEAFLKYQTEQVHAQGAQRTLDLAGAALLSLDKRLDLIPLKIAKGGQVMDIPAHLDEAVESGAEILKLARFDHILAEIDVPQNENADFNAQEARLVFKGMEDKPLIAKRVGAGAVNPKTLSSTLLYQASTDNPRLRPGTPLTAYIAVPGEPLNGYEIPRESVVYCQGKAWVYIAGKEEGHFLRKEVSLDHPLPDGSGWVVVAGFKGDEELVTQGAATLLSVELIAIQGEEE
jgi:hypothetical protein